MSVRHQRVEPPQVLFVGTEPGTGSSYLAAGFYITNSGRQAILLQQVQVQTAADGAWKTLSEMQPEFSRVLEPGATQTNLSPVLEAGERRKIVVQWPEERPWRVCVVYLREHKGIREIAVKARFAWRTRKMPWRSNMWSGRVFDGSDQVASEEVTK